MQNKAYNCSHNDALSQCISILKSANEILSAIAEKQDGLNLGTRTILENVFPANKC